MCPVRAPVPDYYGHASIIHCWEKTLPNDRVSIADDGRKSVKFDGDARSLTNIRIVSVYIVEIANFNINDAYWKITD